MNTIFIRTLIFYVILTCMLRLMGKRQIGQLQTTEFVTAIMLSEVAALPITDSEIPLMHGIIPLITLASLEIVVSYLCLKHTKLRHILDGSPIILINKGEIVEANLKKTRVTLDEIFAEIRASGYKSISEIQYVIFEQTGKLSIIPKAPSAAITPSDMQLNVNETGIAYAVIIDGAINDTVLHDLGKDRKWIYSRLKSLNAAEKNIQYMTVDETGGIILKMKQKTEK